MWGGIDHIPLKGVRKAIAEHMVKSSFTIPHVTHFDEVDAGNLIKAREEKKAQAEKKGIKLTFLPFIIKAVVECLKKHPAQKQFYLMRYLLGR
jgi:pyruvate dehydrogenase E2 component (dihydrolipoamide acetyltransferase)